MPRVGSREARGPDLCRRSARLGPCAQRRAASEASSRELRVTGAAYTPFARGEAMTRQGAEAHWLYMLIAGEGAVRVSKDGVEREVARLHAGSFFGEMSLLTGARRTATVVAVTDV